VRYIKYTANVQGQPVMSSRVQGLLLLLGTRVHEQPTANAVIQSQMRKLHLILKATKFVYTL